MSWKRLAWILSFVSLFVLFLCQHVQYLGIACFISATVSFLSFLYSCFIFEVNDCSFVWGDNQQLSWNQIINGLMWSALPKRGIPFERTLYNWLVPLLFAVYINLANKKQVSLGHILTTYQPQTNRIYRQPFPTTYRPHINHIQTTYRPHPGRLYRPHTNDIQTTYRPPSPTTCTCSVIPTRSTCSLLPCASWLGCLGRGNF